MPTQPRQPRAAGRAAPRRRTRNFLGGGAAYELRVEASDRLLLAARPRGKNKCSAFLVTLREAAGDAAPDSEEAVAKVRAPCLRPMSGNSTHARAGGSDGGPPAPPTPRQRPRLKGRLMHARAKVQCGIILIIIMTVRPPCTCTQVKANLMGSDYVAWQKGGGPGAHKGYGAQALAVRYHPTSSSPSGGARQLTAILPTPGEGRAGGWGCSAGLGVFWSLA